MKPSLVLWLLALITFSLQAETPSPASQDADFQKFADSYTDGYLAWRPQTASGLGLHEYDGRVTDFRRASVELELERLQIALKTLKTFDPARLNPTDAVDWRILQSAINQEIFWFLDARYFSRNPMTYAEAIDLEMYLKRDYAPLPDRVRALVATEREIPAMLDAAKGNLDKKLPKPFVDTALETFDGLKDFLQNDLPGLVNTVKEPVLLGEFAKVNKTAIQAVGDFSDYLRTDKLPAATPAFALGVEKFTDYLHDCEQINLTPYQLLALGKRELKAEQDRFAAAARIIDPTRPAVEVFAEIQGDHPTAASLLPDARKHLEQIHQFVLDHQIISVPSTERVQVAETPKADRATGTAGMDSPGPFEKSTTAYYYINPVEKGWNAERTGQYLSSFNYYTTDVVSIHEAYPGHYIQFLHLKASNATRVEKVFDSYSFVEGWAHYCEQMLIDEGYGSGGDPKQVARYRLAQSDEALLRLCRLCVSVGMHCQGMTVGEATKFIEDNCYYEKAPAEQEALRGTYDPGYLAYTLGKLEILKLRKDYQIQEGTAYSLQKFHDALLDHGMPPVRALRGLLLNDPNQAAQTLSGQ